MTGGGLRERKKRVLDICAFGLSHLLVSFKCCTFVFETEEILQRTAAKSVPKHLWSILQNKHRAPAKRCWYVSNFHPTLGLPSHVLCFFSGYMFGFDHRGSAVVLLKPFVDDESAFTKLPRHRRTRVRCRMLNIRPVYILLGKFKIGLN